MKKIIKCSFVEKELSQIPRAERLRVFYSRGQILQKKIPGFILGVVCSSMYYLSAFPLIKGQSCLNKTKMGKLITYSATDFYSIKVNI